MKLRIAARFLRRSDYKVVQHNFYDSVFQILNEMEPAKRLVMKELVCWVLDYETVETAWAPAQSKKPKTLARKGAGRLAGALSETRRIICPR